MYRIDYYWHEMIADDRFRYAVIAARHAGQWLFVRQKTRDSYELPAGRRESGESIEGTARRELYEETGAVRFALEAVCAFAVSPAGQDPDPEGDCGMLYLAEVFEREDIPIESEIGEVRPGARLPEPLHYPEIQPKLFALAEAWSGYRVRPALPEDAAAICRINSLGLGYDYPEDKTAGKLAVILAAGQDGLFVAEHRASSELAGYIHLGPYECTYADSLKNILSLAVLPEHQGKMVGRMLLAEGERWARAAGASGVRLVSGSDRTGAHRFYAACGYRLRKDQKNFIKQWLQ